MSINRNTHVHKDQMLTGGLEFYHITTAASIVPTSDKDSDDVSEQREYFAQARVWEKVIETIRTRSNVVIIGALDDNGFSFAVEHKDAIDVDQMQTLLQSLGEQSFSVDGVTTVDLSAIELQEVPEFRLVEAPVDEEPVDEDTP